MLEMCRNPPDRTCPFCGEVYEDNAEYVDVGVGGRGVQVTANVCENCGAQEQGCYKYEGDEWEFSGGWVRHKYERPSVHQNNPDEFDWEYLADLEGES